MVEVKIKDEIGAIALPIRKKGGTRVYGRENSPRRDDRRDGRGLPHRDRGLRLPALGRIGRSAGQCARVLVLQIRGFPQIHMRSSICRCMENRVDTKFGFTKNET